MLRPTESTFEGLPDYPFFPHYVEVAEGLRMHYVDEGNPQDPVVLLLHGEPSWSFLYRKMIPGLVAARFRVIAPDLIGFGKSDKYVEQEAYTYQRHIDWLKQFLLVLDLQAIHLFCQDWGGLLGLRVVTELPDRFAKIVASNTGLPTGKYPPSPAFEQWLTFSQTSESFPISRVIQMGVTQTLTSEVLAAYDKPFPSEAHKGGARRFPALVPTQPDDPEAQRNLEAWKFLSTWEKPFLTIFGSKDWVTKGGEKFFIRSIPGAQGQPHDILEAGHFIQEEAGEELVQRLIPFFR
ncbi:MAG: haloalkane dehalogenase [Bacteroidota bacterium]